MMTRNPNIHQPISIFAKTQKCNEKVSTGGRRPRSRGWVLPHDSANAWTSDEEFSGRRAFDGWRFTRFAETDRLIPWDWADMGTFEQRQWIERGKQGRAA